MILLFRLMSDDPHLLIVILPCRSRHRQDDVGDHDKWANHFKAPRIIHEKEVRAAASCCSATSLCLSEGAWVGAWPVFESLV